MSHSNNKSNYKKLPLRGASVSKQARIIANSIFALSVFCFAFLIALISGTLFFSLGESMAETRGVGFSASVESVIGLSTNALNDEVVFNITPTPTGILTSEELIVTVSTNNSTGYKLKMSSLTDNTDLVSVLDPNQPNASPNPIAPLAPTLPVIASTTAPIGAPAVLSSNTWGYTLTTPLPSTPLFSRIPIFSSADTLKDTVGPDVASTTIVTFGVNINNTIPSGAYTGTIVLTAVGNPTPDIIRITNVVPSVNWSGGDIYLAGTNFPTTTTGTTITIGGTPCASIRLIDTNNAICVLPNKPTGSTYPVVITSAALGKSNTNRTVTYDGSNKGNMQDFSQTNCTAMLVGLTQIYTDTRNNANYRVKKMLDNKCWMIDNLAYRGDPLNEDNTYGDTHSLDFHTACGTDYWNDSVVSTCNGPTTWLSNNNTRRVTTNNFTGGDLNDRVGNNIQNTEANFYPSSTSVQCTDSATSSDSMRSVCISYLYNWCAVVGLDSTTNPTCNEVREDSTVDDSNGSTTGGNVNTGMADAGIVGKPGGIGGESKGNNQAANQAGVAATNGSICPAGWRLPVGRVGASDNTYNEFAILNGAMFTLGQDLSPDNTNDGPTRAINWYPGGSFSATSSGYFNYAQGLFVQSRYSYYWSASLNSATSAQMMNLNTDNVSPGTPTASKSGGLAVRCVL